MHRPPLPLLRLFLLGLLPGLPACRHLPGAATPASDAAHEQRYHQAGLVTLQDLRHGSEWEKLIHSDMGVPHSKIEVQAGVGVTTLIIKDLKNRADAESVAEELRAVAARKPEKFGVTKVEIRLGGGTPATISPFVLPTEAPQQLTPGSDLPTISLPPLRTDGR